MRGGLSPKRELRRQFWLLIRSGLPRKRAAVALGLNEDTGKEWFGQAGGGIPAYVPAPPSGRYLPSPEREVIFACVERNDSIALISKDSNPNPLTLLP